MVKAVKARFKEASPVSMVFIPPSLPPFPGDRNPSTFVVGQNVEGGQTARVSCYKNSILKIGGLVLPLLLEREGERLLITFRLSVALRFNITLEKRLTKRSEIISNAS